MRYVINHDPDCESPREYALGTMVCWHRRYKLGDEQPKQEPREWRRAKRMLKCILPVYMYDHSGLALNTKGFSCPWDSGQVGWIYMTMDKVHKYFEGDIGEARKALRSEVEVYSKYVNGECYEYQILDDEDNVVDGCSGFIGYEVCEQEAKERLEG